MQWRFGYYLFSDSFGYRTIFDECAFSNHFQCRDLHVVTWMHMTSRLNTTRGSQWWQKKWRRCARIDWGQEADLSILARGHLSHILGVQGHPTTILVLLEILVGLLPVSYW